MAIDTAELQELIDNPNETLDVEYKEWLDLSGSPEVRADLARHIAALANFGGGKIVLGITDDMKYAGRNSSSWICDRDVISGIVKKYLEPTFQCDVRIVKSAAGNEHSVIIVPPHGPAPICAKSDGPLIDGKRKGISQGVYYTRKPGPESAPILTATEWAPIIRRCAMHERAAILGAIDAALRGAGALQAADSDKLKSWHEAAHAAFLKGVLASSVPNLEKWHYQFSYAIERTDGQQLDPNQLADVLRQVNGEVRDLVPTGVSMFYVYSRPEIAPFIHTDPSSGLGNQDFLECGDTQEEMWRASPDGKATLIRGYREDDPAWNKRLGLAPGTWLSPSFVVRSLAEFVRHARGVAERFEAATAVSFRCDWYGLAGRKVFDPNPLISWHEDHPRARTDLRTSSGSWPVITLATGWAEIVVALAAPLVRIFGVEQVVTPKWVVGEASNWRR